MKNIKNFTIIILFIIIWSCGDDSNPIEDIPNVQDGEIVPLTVGNEWKYIDSIFNIDGVYTGISYSSVKVTEIVELFINGEKNTLYTWKWSNSIDSAKFLCANNEFGFNLYGSIRGNDTTIYDPLSLYAKYPINQNETWDWYYNMYVTTQDTAFYTSGSTEVKCLALNKPFLTPFGEIDCIVYEFKDSSETGARTYYSPKLGFIGREEIWHGVTRVKKVLSEVKIIDK
ncbi:MAG: hypothetical protein IPH62_00210 [Ignavibacteriae bacterium]|nr:hypothetical protein [Ignavibacteriota bacterium]